MRGRKASLSAMIGRDRGLSLRARITLGVGVASAVILAAFGGLAAWAIHDSVAAVLRTHVRAAEKAASLIAEILTARRGDLAAFGGALSDAPSVSSQQITRLPASAPRRFVGLAVLAPDGRLLWSRPEGWLPDATARELRLIASPPLTAVVPPLPPAAGHGPLLTFILPAGGIGRLLVGAIDLQREPIPPAVNAGGLALETEVIDSSGLILASSNPKEVGQTTEHLPVLVPFILQGRPGIALHDLPSLPHYAAYAPLPGYPGLGIAVEQAPDLAAVAVALPPHRLWPRVLVIGGLLVAGMSFLALLDVRRVIQPLGRLRQAADQIAGGDLDHRIRLTRRDEVGALARAFEAMRVHLKASREEIAGWTRELEARVAARTRELAAMAADNARLAALARREERNLAATVDLLSDGLLTLSLDRRILSLNAAAERLLEWSTADAQGLPCSDLLACPGCRPGDGGSRCLLEGAREPGRAVRGVRIQARRRSGQTFPVVLTAGLGRDEADQPTHFIVTISDMTTEDAYERQLRRRIRQLTVLHEVTQALNLLPLRSVEETVRDIVERIAAATGGQCRLDLAAGRSPTAGHEAQGGLPVETERAAEDAPALPGADLEGLVSAPLVVQGRRIGTLWLDPGPARLTEGSPSLLSTIAAQVAVAVENARLYEDVRERDALRRRLLDRIVTAQEEERRRIARELHDEVGQTLTAFVMQLGAAEAALPAEAAPLRERLTGIRELMSQAVEEVRRLMRDLRPVVLDDLGLVSAARWYVETHLPAAGIEAQIVVTGLHEHQRLPRHVELVAFRLTQEAVTNILRHAQASRATVALARDRATLTLSISDDGRGFDAEAGRRPGHDGGWGLVGMEERVALLGGALTVTSRPGRGTRITATIPIAEDGDDR